MRAVVESELEAQPSLTFCHRSNGCVDFSSKTPPEYRMETDELGRLPTLRVYISTLIFSGIIWEISEEFCSVVVPLVTDRYISRSRLRKKKHQPQKSSFMIS